MTVLLNQIQFACFTSVLVPFDPFSPGLLQGHMKCLIRVLQIWSYRRLFIYIIYIKSNYDQMIYKLNNEKLIYGVSGSRHLQIPYKTNYIALKPGLFCLTTNLKKDCQNLSKFKLK